MTTAGKRETSFIWPIKREITDITSKINHESENQLSPLNAQLNKYRPIILLCISYL